MIRPKGSIVWKAYIMQLTKVLFRGFKDIINDELLLFGKYLMGTIYLFAGKFSYIILNKTVYEKVVEMSTKRRQCRNNPDVFSYICGEYMIAKYRFNVRDFT